MQNVNKLLIIYWCDKSILRKIKNVFEREILMFDKLFKKSSKRNLNNDFLPAVDGCGYQIKVPYEYPFSMSDKDLLASIQKLEINYNEIYRATNLILYINKGEYQNGIVSKIEDVEHLIIIGKNELLRRTNDLILKKSLIISKWTLAIAIASVIVAVISICR